jgi:predicted O-methyltransferase YrrM
MNAERWSEVDRFFEERLVAGEPSLDAALTANAEAGLPKIDVSATQGKFLRMLARVHGARRILEIGTLGGYSTIWLAGSLPSGGRVTTLELVPKHAEVARQNIERAGYGDLVDVRVGSALELLDELVSEGVEPFDLTFIDADKVGTPDYFDRAVRLSKTGSVIVVDNVVRDGAIVEQGNQDASVRGMQRFVEALATDERVTATALQTVGNKGYDGFVLALVF